MKKVVSLILWLVVLAGIGAGGYAAWNYWQTKEKQPVYRTTEVVRGDMIRSVTATGQLDSLVKVEVGSQISGQIQKIFVDYNSSVKAGDIIAQIDSSTFQAQVLQAEGDLANAQANLSLNKPIMERQQALFAKGMTSQASLDKATADFQQAEANVKIKEAALRKIKIDLERCTIYSPIDGIVISRSVDVGQTVAASLNTPTLFVIANDLTKMQIDANVAEADIGNVEVGQEVEFTVDAFPERKFHGKVSQVRNAATTTQNVVTYDTIIDVDNSELKLKPGMTANVSIITAKHENVLMVSNAALRFSPSELSGENGKKSEWKKQGRGKKEFNEKSVYVVIGDLKENNIQKARIKVGITDGANTEIADGLNEGDVVITGEATSNSNSKSTQNKNPFSGGGPPGGGPGMRRM